jgi:hypothetical protein
LIIFGNTILFDFRYQLHIGFRKFAFLRFAWDIYGAHWHGTEHSFSSNGFSCLEKNWELFGIWETSTMKRRDVVKLKIFQCKNVAKYNKCLTDGKVFWMPRMKEWVESLEDRRTVTSALLIRDLLCNKDWLCTCVPNFGLRFERFMTRFIMLTNLWFLCVDSRKYKASKERSYEGSYSEVFFSGKFQWK